MEERDRAIVTAQGRQCNALARNVSQEDMCKIGWKENEILKENS